LKLASDVRGQLEKLNELQSAVDIIMTQDTGQKDSDVNIF